MLRDSIPSKPGIYRIVNTSNGNFYIGSTIHLRNRRKAHFDALKRGDHVNRHLQSAYNLYGEGNFTFEVVENVSDTSLLLEREQHYIDTLSPQYNILLKAGSMLGYKHTEEAKAKFVGFWDGRKHSPETIEKMKNREVSQETRDETSARQKGDPFWIEHCRKMNEKKRDMPIRDTTRTKLSAIWKDRKRSEENRRHNSEAAKRRHAQRREQQNALNLPLWDNLDDL